MKKSSLRANLAQFDAISSCPVSCYWGDQSPPYYSQEVVVEIISLRRVSLATPEDVPYKIAVAVATSWFLCSRSIFTSCINHLQHAALCGAGPGIRESSPRLILFAAALLGWDGRAAAQLCQIHALGPQLASQAWHCAKFTLFQLWRQGFCWLLKWELESAEHSKWSLIWTWKLIQNPPPLIVRTYIRYTLGPCTFSSQNNMNVTLLYKYFFLLNTWTRWSSENECSLGEARGALVPLLSNDQGSHCIL